MRSSISGQIFCRWTRFSLYPADLSLIKDFFDSVLYPLLETEKEAASFNFSLVQEILSSITARVEGEEAAERLHKLDEIIAKIDRLLSAIESDMLIADLGLTRRNDEESLEYLLARYEEKFSFLQYALIQFLCLIKIKLLKEKESFLRKVDEIMSTRRNLKRFQT
ncbi:MAG: hypothetical protein L0Y73_05975 [Candidatus Aminicenantes bacterium]|nr:hypothetical protein [Candidatus Aminicenantes bacterium]